MPVVWVLCLCGVGSGVWHPLECGELWGGSCVGVRGCKAPSLLRRHRWGVGFVLAGMGTLLPHHGGGVSHLSQGCDQRATKQCCPCQPGLRSSGLTTPSPSPALLAPTQSQGQPWTALDTPTPPGFETSVFLLFAFSKRGVLFSSSQPADLPLLPQGAPLTPAMLPQGCIFPGNREERGPCRRSH